MRPDRSLLILLVGPTSVGKTEMAIHLAEALNGEIVSADSRLFYRGMDIGTAKPSRADLSRVAHHLIDILDPDGPFNLVMFKQEAQSIIADIQGRGKLPFLVGGTGQYIRAVTQGWSPPEVEADERLRRVLERMQDQFGADWLHDRLMLLDPAAAEKIDPRNVRRTIRALEVIFKTGQRFSKQRGQGPAPYELITIGLSRPRQELYARLDARIEAMFAQGFVEEVARLLSRGYSPALPSMSAIGYRECVKIVKGEWSIEQAKEEIRRKTRVFVRRQSNWFRESDPSIHWFQVHDNSFAEIEKDLRALIDF